jgi:hypothetical protein
MLIAIIAVMLIGVSLTIWKHYRVHREQERLYEFFAKKYGAENVKRTANGGVSCTPGIRYVVTGDKVKVIRK